MNPNTETSDNLSVGNEIARNLLRLDQLSDLGLEFFSDSEKFDGDMKQITLESSLLNGTSEQYCPLDTVDGFEPFPAYVSPDMPSQSSPQGGAELIEVFPITNSDLDSNTHDDGKQENTLLVSIEANDVQMKSCSNRENSASRRKALPVESNVSQGKKFKIRRVISKSKPIKVAFVNDVKNLESSDLNNYENELLEYNDNTELENKINDSLLDMLQKKIGISKNCQSFHDVKKGVKKGCLKFVTISPVTTEGKTINLMIKGKTCRSKQPLTDIELRIVNKIFSHVNESEETYGNSSYKDVYYDDEIDTNIRYEVKYELGSSEYLSSENLSAKCKVRKNRSKIGQCTEERQSTDTDKAVYVVNTVARTRCGRISRPPRHVIRDYKRLQRLEESIDVDENENNGGYADYRINESNTTAVTKDKEVPSEDLYAPLEPSKRQFSSLSRCPTCDKIYLGYQRMAIHFQKYPDHKDDELLKRLLNSTKRSIPGENESCGNPESGTVGENFHNVGEHLSLTNSLIKRRGRMPRRLRMRASKNGSLKDILSSYRVEDVIKYAAPIVTQVLSSWEYILMRSKKLKQDQEPLITSLLRELGSVLKQIRSVSRNLLRPYIENEHSKKAFTVENEDVLQYVLGLSPGKYACADDEEWSKRCAEYDTSEKAVDLKDEYAILCSSTIKDDDPNGLLVSAANVVLDETSQTNTLYTISNEQPITFSVILHKNPDVYSELNSNIPSTIETQLPFSNVFDKISHNVQFDSINNSNMRRNSSSLEVPEPAVLKRLDACNSADARLHFEPQFGDKSFSPSHNLNFDSLVDDVSNDIMHDFPINLQMLSENSSDNKDCLDLLNSLKRIDGTVKSEMSDLRTSLSFDLPVVSKNSSACYDSLTDSYEAPCALDFTSKLP